MVGNKIMDCQLLISWKLCSLIANNLSFPTLQFLTPSNELQRRIKECAVGLSWEKYRSRSKWLQKESVHKNCFQSHNSYRTRSPVSKHEHSPDTIHLTSSVCPTPSSETCFYQSNKHQKLKLQLGHTYSTGCQGWPSRSCPAQYSKYCGETGMCWHPEWPRCNVLSGLLGGIWVNRF